MSKPVQVRRAHDAALALLDFFADARGLSGKYRQDRIEKVIDQCRARQPVIGKAIGKLSKGYRQRVGMAQGAAAHEPEVLILDEPTAWSSIRTRIREVRETIRRLGQDKTILLSTHILQEVEAMASRVLFINEGRLKFDGAPAQLAADAAASTSISTNSRPEVV